MDIYETGKQSTVLQFDHTGAGNRGSVGGKGNNTSVLHKHGELLGGSLPKHSHLIQENLHLFFPPAEHCAQRYF